jgi:hypothetical protein
MVNGNPDALAEMGFRGWDGRASVPEGNIGDNGGTDVHSYATGFPILIL